MASNAANSCVISSPVEESESRPTHGPSTTGDSYRDKIMAFLEDSDDESSVGKASPGKIASFFSSPPKEQGDGSQEKNYDLDLNDDDEPVIGLPASSNPAAEGEDDGSAAYARMLKNLAKPTSKPADALRKPPTPRQSSPVGEASEDSEDEIPVRKSKVPRKSAITSSPVRSSSPALQKARRSASPSLFVSPAKSQYSSPLNPAAEDAGSDSDEMPSTSGNPRLQLLIAKKRAEREAKENAEWRKAREAKKTEAEKQKKLAKQFEEIYSSEMNDGMTDEGRAALAEQSRPMRKASKKALEEMNRETQRMARNQQLTHQVKVKKKLTTMDFIKAMGLKQDDADAEQPISRAANSSDHEGLTEKETPPSSPPSQSGSHSKAEAISHAVEDEDEYIIRTGVDDENDRDLLMDLKTVLSQPREKLDKGKGSAVETVPAPPQPAVSNNAAKKPSKQIRVIPSVTITDDSDDDLEIMPLKKSRFAVFDNLPEKKANESRSILNLRAFASMGSAGGEAGTRNKGRPSITLSELQMKLKEAMYKQTMADKQEKLDELKRRGIIIPTEEEREQDQLFLENSLEAARKDAMELAKKEKATADKDGKTVDENYALPSDDESEDGDWEGVDEEEAVDPDIELSGSEDENAGEDEAEDGASVHESNDLVDDAAEEDDEDEEMVDPELEDEREEAAFAMLVEEDRDEASALVRSRAKPRNRQVIIDDDEEDEEPLAPPAETQTPMTQPSQINAFGFDLPQSSMSLTQMFKGTMADLSTQLESTQAAAQSESLEFLRNIPVSTMPVQSPTNPVQPFLIQDSQSYPIMETPSKPSNAIAATPILASTHFSSTVGSQMSPTKLSEIPDPTQDVGFESFRASAIEDPHSTVETVIVPVADSPILRKKGKLHRRSRVVTVLSEDEAGNSADGEADSDEEETFELTTNAFDALFKANKKPAVPIETFDKKNSRARNMVEEQAEESDDEYHGLGGASDDESNGEMDEEMKKMIDESHIDVDEGQLAKFYVENDRVEDEKRVDKLYRDVMTGALRKKRGGGVDDLSDDSDDEAMERRRAKQREFAKMRRALLEDENLGKIAENPKKLAFLRAVEDRDEEDGIDLLDFIDEEVNAVPASQNETGEQQASGTQPQEPSEIDSQTNTGLGKRKLPSDFSAQDKENIIPNMSHRRSNPRESVTKRPTTLAEVRESISFLIDEPLVPDSQVSDASDEEAEYPEDAPIRYVRARRSDENGTSVLTSLRASVINRLTTSTSIQEDDTQTSGPMAFHTTSAAAATFKIPSLLRRGTTNLSTSSSGTTTPVEGGVRRGGSKKSNIHFQAREAERMKKVKGVEERRREGIRKRVVGKGRQSVLGRSLGAGGNGFE